MNMLTTRALAVAVALAFSANLMPFPRYILEIVFVATGALTAGSGLHYLYRASSRRFVGVDHDS